jgi:hypothetical protein
VAVDRPDGAAIRPAALAEDRAAPQLTAMKADWQKERAAVARRTLSAGLILAALVFPFGASAAIGDHTGTSTPDVIVPETAPAPQTPAYPTPPVGANGIGVASPRAHRQFRNNTAAPRVIAPVIPTFGH